MIPARNHRHARESGHPGRAGTAFAGLGARFRAGNEWQLTYPTYSILDAALDGSFGAWAGIAIDGSERPLRVQPA